ncbi:zinc finger CCCH domain-containing protein 3 isoform X1 [Sorghum bicolor]|uniref:zinc finger CCCH domain-containing protein 3 isoform X1 n=1 Tax=Sorghum bicolor TaxID=4558 RepID=UPI000B42605B|nr:zinc finger CCCH domain-containing protein 3 isoform X1 [Sorghum bicolor]XP_021311129.1 zinc finger CCCH domain-containing protein 3 isoform X1 [Sorghum bicolor]|eukprot:XP_021311128.1 zinc finger CCCH domain-containing protein 3 isoform X1 [Sorghum bicolor]
MPLGKYYCDYCDKQFQDTPAARRRHLQGVQHQRARALWYDSIRHQGQPATLLFPFFPFPSRTSLPLLYEQHGGVSSLLLPDGTLAKGICHHFVRTGTCKYGDSCRYFHPKPDGVNPALAAPGSGPGPMVQQSDFIGNQPNFVGYQGPDRNSFSGNILGGHTAWGNLPPSLQPPPEGGYPPLPFIDWG